VGILTGHCLAASHATTLGILNSRTCRKCDESGAIEALEHLIRNCPALSLFGFAKNISILVDIKTS